MQLPTPEELGAINRMPEAEYTPAEHKDLMSDVVRIVAGKGVNPEQQVAILLLASITILNDMLKMQPDRRGKLLNIMTAEYRRLLQKYLTLTVS